MTLWVMFPPTMTSYRAAHSLNDIMYPGNVTQITNGVIEMSPRLFSVLLTLHQHHNHPKKHCNDDSYLTPRLSTLSDIV